MYTNTQLRTDRPFEARRPAGCLRGRDSGRCSCAGCLISGETSLQRGRAEGTPDSVGLQADRALEHFDRGGRATGP